MERPRVMIADEDISYIIPLQYKFVKEFFNQIDLEIITDRGYFQEMFVTPQRIDLLIVSQELYSSQLRKHNITNIFVMTEQLEETGTEELNATRMFKYTSIKEIFTEIISKSAGVLSAKSGEKKKTQVLLVTSAAGGTGKTTISMGVAACLEKNNKRVLYINACRLQSFQYLLDNKTPISSPEIYSKLANPMEQIYYEIKHVIRKELFSYLPAFKAGIMSVGLEYSLFRKIAESARKSAEYDYIIVDAESTFDEEKTKLLGIADKILIITEQTLASVHATNALISNINGTASDKYLFICNKFHKESDNALTASDLAMKFTVNEYIEHMDRRASDDLSQNNGIRRITFLVM